MKEDLRFEKEIVERYPKYFGNTDQAFYLFKYASMNEQFARKLSGLVCQAIIDGGFNDATAYKFAHNAVLESNELFKIFNS